MLSPVTFATHILHCRVSDAWWEKICFNVVVVVVVVVVILYFLHV